MSAPSGVHAFRKTTRQFVIALALCAGVAGGATIGAAPWQEDKASRVTADNDWPKSSPTPAGLQF